MWANYDIPEKHDLLTSANYLNGMITKLAGLETTPYQNFLETLRQKVPVISTQGFFDENEQYNDYSKLDNYSSLISDYRTLQYYMMNDK